MVLSPSDFLRTPLTRLASVSDRHVDACGEPGHGGGADVGIALKFGLDVALDVSSDFMVALPARPVSVRGRMLSRNVRQH
jgi:hypothetical protein